MTSIVSDALSSKVIVGVDNHKHIHVAVAINQHGTRLGDRAVERWRYGHRNWAGSTGSGSRAPAATALG